MSRVRELSEHWDMAPRDGSYARRSDGMTIGVGSMVPVRVSGPALHFVAQVGGKPGQCVYDKHPDFSEVHEYTQRLKARTLVGAMVEVDRRWPRDEVGSLMTQLAHARNRAEAQAQQVRETAEVLDAQQRVLAEREARVAQLEAKLVELTGLSPGTIPS